MENMENQKKGNAYSIVALVTGLIAIIGAFIPLITYVAWVVGIIAIVFAAIGMKCSKETNTGHGLAVAGLVLGIIGTVVGILGFLCIVACASLVATA